MEEDVLILLGVAFNLNLPLLTAWLLDHWLGVATPSGGRFRQSHLFL